MNFCSSLDANSQGYEGTSTLPERTQGWGRDGVPWSKGECCSKLRMPQEAILGTLCNGFVGKGVGWD